MRAEDDESLAIAEFELIDIDDEATAISAAEAVDLEEGLHDQAGFGSGSGAPGVVAPLRLPCCSRVRSRLTAKAIPRTMSPRASAIAICPRRVSRTIAVVMTRVLPRMLPPTIMTAPTSEKIEPKPATQAAPRPSFASRICIQSARAGLAPRARAWSRTSAGIAWTAAILIPVM